MLRGSQRGGDLVTGSALIGLLTRLTDARPQPPRHVFAERLSHWLGWADAISLSSALTPSPPADDGGGALDAAVPEAARLRAALARGHAQAVQDTCHDTAHMTSTPASASFLPFRRCYHERQQAMGRAIGPLRTRLRARLAGRSAAQARLAAVDAVMAQVVGERERALLASVPVLLEKRFEQWRQAAMAEPAGAAGAPPWHHAFGQDMLAVLLAELDLRLQPVEGLSAALGGANASSAAAPSPAHAAPLSPAAPLPSS